MDTATSPARRTAFAAAVAILVLALVPVALAAKGGNGNGKSPNTSGSSLTLKMVADANGDGLPNWGDTVTFNVSTTATTQPNVDFTCSQNGTVVYGATSGFYASYPWPWTQNMTLRSSAWSGGAATCTARLYAFAGSGTTTLATLSFTAGA